MSPADTGLPRRTQRQRTELSDRLMLDAARALILEMGTAATTLREVGERAGYSRGMAHARFGSKEALFLRLSEQCLESWVIALQEASRGKQGLDALLSRFDAVASYVANNPDDARVLYILWFESVGSSSPMRKSLETFHGTARHESEALLKAAQRAGDVNPKLDARLLSLQFTSTLFGIAYQWLVSPAAFSLARDARGLRDQLRSLLQH